MGIVFLELFRLLFINFIIVYNNYYMCLSGHADVAQMSKVSSSSTSLQDDIPQVFHLDAKGNDSFFFFVLGLVSSTYFCSCFFFPFSLSVSMLLHWL